MLQTVPTLNRVQIRADLIASAQPMNSAPKGTWDPEAGYGLINAVTVLNMLAPLAGSPTNTVVGASSTSLAYGQAVTLTATVQPASSGGSGPPTGSVDFIDTATNTDLGSFPLSAGVATLTATPIGRGIHLYLVIYSGDSHFARSSSYLMVTVAGYSSDTTASTSSSNPVFGQTVMLTATVQPASPSSILPTGSVDFYDETDGIDLGVVPLSSGVATLTTNSLSIGNLTIQVLYLGDFAI